MIARNSERRAVTCFAPSEQSHGIGSLEIRHPLRGASWAVPRGGTGLATRCEIPALGAGACSVLVQLHHRARAGQDLARIVVEAGGARTTHPVAARRLGFAEWQREIIPVTGAGATFAVEIHATGVAFRSGTISVARAGKRPFYSIAHMCNAPSYVRRALDEGANAIECDVQAERSGAGMTLRAHHGFRVPYGARSLARTPIAVALDELSRVADRLALVVFDCKPMDGAKDADYRAYGAELARAIGGRLPAGRCLVSIHSQAMAAVFAGVRDAGFGAGRDVNMIDNTAYERDDLWIDEAEAAGVTMLGIGTDCFVPWDLLRSWLGPIGAVVNGRDGNERVRKAYYWTLGSAAAMRKMLDLQVDGIIVNDPRTLARVLSEEPYREIYRLAEPGESQFEVHGQPTTA